MPRLAGDAKWELSRQSCFHDSRVVEVFSECAWWGAAMGLQLCVRHAADVVIVDLRGKATIGRANEFLDSQLRQLIEVGTSKLLLNLTDVTQLDSSSIASIVRAFTLLKHRGASLKLLRPRGNVRLVLETVHLLDVIPSVEDETEAIASFN